MISKFLQAKNYYRGGNRPNLIVIHDMEYPERPTGAEWCADYFATSAKASAHYCVDNDSIVQCVLDTDGAWHTPGSIGGVEINRQSIGIEHAGYAKQTAAEWRDAYSTAMLEMSARLVAELCVKHMIPAVKLSPEQVRAGARGICGHDDCTKATKVGSHWDPGPHFPWDWYMERVRAHMEIPTLADSEDGWVPIQLGSERFIVAPIYVPFVGIGQAADLAASLGCELPTPALVDAIWLAADLKIDASQMVISDHDGTTLTMSSAATFLRVEKKLEALMAGHALGVDFRLLAGAFKDVCNIGGKLGLYGWHRPDGSVIQPEYTKHARGWVDYSQGLRLVKRVIA